MFILLCLFDSITVSFGIENCDQKEENHEKRRGSGQAVLRPILKSIVRTRFFFVLPSSLCLYNRHALHVYCPGVPVLSPVRPLMLADRPLWALSTTACSLLYFFSLYNIRERPRLISRVVTCAEREWSSFIDHPRLYDRLLPFFTFSKLYRAYINIISPSVYI